MHARNRTWPLGSDPAERCRQRTMPVEGGDGSTLSLDFTTGVLDPRLTFTRSTNATFINSQGYVQYANANIIRQSENCGSWSGAQNITPTADAAIAPNGTQTADQLNLLASSYRYQVTSTTYAVGQQYVGSIWMRTVSGTASVGFRIANATTGANSAIATCSVTETWQRFNTPAFTLTDTANRVIDIGIDQRSTVSGPNVAANIYVWGLQLQPGTSAGEYLPTTTTENLNTPRFDYDPTSIGTPRGLLLEGSANNQVTNSGTFSSATWTYVQTASGTAVLAPDNTQTAILLQENSTTNQHVVSQGSRTVTANAANTASMWIRRNGTRRYILLRVNDNSSNANAASVMFDTQTGTVSTNGAATAYGTFSAASATVTPYPAYDGTNEWYRLSMTFTVPVGMTLVSFKAELSATDSRSADGQSVSYLGNGTNGVYVWGAQLETGSGASSYIPTGASQGSRSADNCVMTGTNFSSWYTQGIGTVCWSGSAFRITAGHLANINTVNNDPRITAYVGAGSLTNLVTNSGTQVSMFFGSVTANTAFKAAWRFSTNDFAACLNAGTVYTDTAGTVPTGVDRMQIGAAEGGYQFIDGWIKSIKYYPTAFTNAQLQTATTL
jgi:hypothetical protein